MPRHRIFTGYDVVDNAYFARRTLEIRKSHLRRGYGGQAAFEIRKKYGLPETYFLASARFIEKKNLSRLIRAYAEYRQRSQGDEPWDPAMLGDGPMRATLHAHLATLTLHPHVR